MPMKSLADAFYEELRDVLSAERQLTRVLPKLAKKAGNEQLRAALETHLEETKRQVERVEQAFEDTGKAARSKRCEAMEGLIQEAEEVLKESPAPEVLDAMMIACQQKVEHYEIATYGTLCTWAKCLGYDKALKLLKETLAEEEATDQKLTKLSEKVNQMAMA